MSLVCSRPSLLLLVLPFSSTIIIFFFKVGIRLFVQKREILAAKTRVDVIRNSHFLLTEVGIRFPRIDLRICCIEDAAATVPDVRRESPAAHD